MAAPDGFILPDCETASRDALAKLAKYEEILLKWQKSINIVANSTLPDLWHRHFLDSWQLARLVNQIASRDAMQVADLGSGGGFPGMVLAIAGVRNVNLIESDQRKCAFLREVSREIFQNDPQNKPQIHNQRIENVEMAADIITSRAFADLAKTLEISDALRQPHTTYLLLKPLDMEKELTEATKYWYFKHEIIPSSTDPRGCILQLSAVEKK